MGIGIWSLVIHYMIHQLTNPEYLKFLLQKHGISPTRSAGQNFLICAEPVEAAVTALKGGPQTITELGAGVGAMTQGLLAAGLAVRAIEEDKALAVVLKKVLGKQYAGQLKLVQNDLRKAIWAHKTDWALAGNIPYNLSGLILRHLTNLKPAPSQAVFMVQQEVGQRLAAGAGNMNLLGLAMQLWGTVHLLLNVPRTCFWPAPQVDSQLVLLVPHASGRAAGEREAVVSLARVFFQRKRKQLRGVLRREFNFTSEKIDEVLSAVGVSATARPQELSVEQWQILSLEMRKNNNAAGPVAAHPRPAVR